MKRIAFAVPLMVSVTCLAQTEFNVLNTVTQNTFVASSFISDSEGWLADNKSIRWQTNDGGMTWDTLFTGISFTSIDFAGSLIGFAVASQQAFKTTDGGKSWQTLNVDKPSGAVCFPDNTTGFFSAYQKVYKTTDGGGSFTSIEIPRIQFNDYFFINDSVAVATAFDDSLNRCIWRTTDGGATWNPAFNEEKYFMNSVWFTGESTGFAAGHCNQPGFGRQPAILKSNDGGITWATIYRNTDIGDPGESLLDIRFRSESEGFAVSSYSLNVITTDGGTSWQIAYRNDTLGLPPERGLYRALDGHSEMYLTGVEGTVVKWE